MNAWQALADWSERLGLTADTETSRRLDDADLDAKIRYQSDPALSEFTRLRNRGDIAAASKLAAR